MSRNRGFGESAEPSNTPRDPNLASEKQVAFIARLLDEKDLFKSPSFWDATNAMDKDEFAAYIQHIKDTSKTITKARAKDIIDALIALPNKPVEGQGNIEPGVYETAEGIFVVKFNRAKTNLYAKKMVEINAERATESGERVEIEFDYAPGAIRRIKAEDKMPLERAKALTIRYGRCINCGRHLKAAESVERGIGPVCIKSFGG